MNPKAHFSDYPSITEGIIAFGQLARLQGLNVGVQENLVALEAARSGLLKKDSTFYYSLKSIYCTDREDLEVFDKLYQQFWRDRKATIKGKTVFKNQSNIQKKPASSLVMMGMGKNEEEQVDSKNVSGASKIARLRKTDFAQLENIDSTYLEKLAQKLWEQMSLRLKRKMKTATYGRRLDLRRTIRSSLSYGGDPLSLKKKRRHPRKQRLIVLLDVSGSMDKYSFFLLRFICALRTHFESIEAFLFSTKLVRITDYLYSENLGLTLSVLSKKADNWSGGTRIGDCLKDFNEEYAKSILNGNSTSIILSDGLDTGEVKVLETELKKIKLRTRQLIWLNPLKGMKGYQPIQRGMEAALPNVDVFKSAHNLDSILELEKFLLNV